MDPKASPWKGVMLPISAQRCAWQPERAQTTKIDPKWRPPTPKILPKWSPKTLPPEIPTSHLGEICGVDFLDPPTNKLYIITANRLSLFTGPAECAKRLNNKTIAPRNKKRRYIYIYINLEINIYIYIYIYKINPPTLLTSSGWWHYVPLYYLYLPPPPTVLPYCCTTILPYDRKDRTTDDHKYIVFRARSGESSPLN